MYIVRKGRKIELTDSEIEAAFRKREREYERIDCINAIYRWFDISEPFTDEEVDNFDRLLSKYGLSSVDIIDIDGKCGIIDQICDIFENAEDCNIADNDIWHFVISGFLGERKEGNR